MARNSSSERYSGSERYFSSEASFNSGVQVKAPQTEFTSFLIYQRVNQELPNFVVEASLIRTESVTSARLEVCSLAVLDLHFSDLT